MSYILEALKRSQQERELGQVPRLHPPFYEPPVAAAAPRPWLLATLAVAALAAVLAAYAVLRSAPATLAPTALPAAPVVAATLVGAPGLTGDAASLADVPLADDPLADDPPVDDPPAAAGRAAVGQGAADPMPAPVPDMTAADSPETAPPDPTADALTTANTATPATVSTPTPAEPAAGVVANSAPAPAVPPQVLVVPAPPKPGEPLPRGADELRRAVLGDAGLGGASLPPPAPPPPTVPASTPIPDDLIADIQAFKRQVGVAPPRSSSASAPAPKLAEPAGLPPPPGLRPPAPAAAASATAPAGLPALGSATNPTAPDAADRPPVASTALLLRMPTLSMSVHVYNSDPDQRFVYVNGSKLRERQRTRDGLRLEQVRADGAVFSFDGERFFQPR